MKVLEAWKKIPDRVDAVIRGGDLDRVIDPEHELTARVFVHHVVEANVVAASIVIAALGSPGSMYDWSWMQPFGPWMDRLDYRRKPVEPAVALLRALNAWVVAQLEPLPDALTREVFLRDEPDGKPRRATVAAVLQQEIDHVQEHLG
jgi:hypothetical protein